VAKDQYVRLKTGWFSDRSACYLAGGPAGHYPGNGIYSVYGGEAGLLAFKSLGEIVESGQDDQGRPPKARPGPRGEIAGEALRSGEGAGLAAGAGRDLDADASECILTFIITAAERRGYREHGHASPCCRPALPTARSQTKAGRAPACAKVREP